MKLRFNRDSLRLRLSPAEVAQLAESGRVEESVPFGSNSRFRYTICRDATICSDTLTPQVAPSVIRALLADNQVIVEVPARLIRDWASGDEVGISAVLDTGGGSLKVLIEKDFYCLDKSVNDPAAILYPNPKASD